MSAEDPIAQLNLEELEKKLAELEHFVACMPSVTKRGLFNDYLGKSVALLLGDVRWAINIDGDIDRVDWDYKG